MTIKTRLIEIEINPSMFYVRVGKLDAVLARDAAGWQWALGQRASWIS